MSKMERTDFRDNKLCLGMADTRNGGAPVIWLSNGHAELAIRDFCVPETANFGVFQRRKTLFTLLQIKNQTILPRTALLTPTTPSSTQRNLLTEHKKRQLHFRTTEKQQPIK